MTIQKKALLGGVIAIWIMLVLQIAASVWSLYWILPWFDILMHFLGGVWLGLTIFALLTRSIPYLLTHKALMVIVLVSGTLFIGFAWEIMEFFLDLVLGTNMFQPDLPDTLIDLAMDMAGSAVSAIGILFFMNKQHV